MLFYMKIWWFDVILTRGLQSAKTGTHRGPIDMNVGVDGALASRENVGNKKDRGADDRDRFHVARPEFVLTVHRHRFSHSSSGRSSEYH